MAECGVGRLPWKLLRMRQAGTSFGSSVSDDANVGSMRILRNRGVGFRPRSGGRGWYHDQIEHYFTTSAIEMNDLLIADLPAICHV